jgi:hypothetical protein
MQLCDHGTVARMAMTVQSPAMPIPANTIYRPKLSHIECALQQIAQIFQYRTEREPCTRSVADLLEFGYTVSSADRRFPHMPA